jgi:uncharacterized integral membrane protein
VRSRDVKLIVFALLVLLMVAVMYQNRHVVTLRFLFWSFQMSQLLLVLLTTAVGFVAGVFVAKLRGGGRAAR